MVNEISFILLGEEEVEITEWTVIYNCFIFGLMSPLHSSPRFPQYICIGLSSQGVGLDKNFSKDCTIYAINTRALPTVMVLWKEIFLQSGNPAHLLTALSQLIFISLFLEGEGGWELAEQLPNNKILKGMYNILIMPNTIPIETAKIWGNFPRL